MINLEDSDALKILDTISEARLHHYHRDAANARLHLAREVRLSPLTSTLDATEKRVVEIYIEQGLLPDHSDE